MRLPKFPKEITKENCTVTIYRNVHTKKDAEGRAGKYASYQLAYRQDGIRKRETSADYAALVARADEVLNDLVQGRTEPGSISAGLRDELFRALDLLAPTGASLIVAATHFAKAVEILGADLVIAAARDFARRQLNIIDPRPVSAAVTEFIAEKERQKRSKTHVARLRAHLNKFASAMIKPLATVTAPEIELFLDHLKADDNRRIGPRTRDNYADSIVTLFRWAKLKRYVPTDFDEAERVTRLNRDEDGEIEIYSPSELRAWLTKAESELIPFIAIGAFAGLRSSEILRLDWADVKLENGSSCIVVQKGKVKKRGRSRRIVPMVENLKAWLAPHLKPHGPVWPHSEPLLYKRLQRLAPKVEELLRETTPNAKLPWKENALRHSFISYRVMTIKNVPQVALESGNSPQIIDSNYRELVTEPEAQEWFSITPPARA